MAGLTAEGALIMGLWASGLLHQVLQMSLHWARKQLCCIRSHATHKRGNLLCSQVRRSLWHLIRRDGGRGRRGKEGKEGKGMGSDTALSFKIHHYPSECIVIHIASYYTSVCT